MSDSNSKRGYFKKVSEFEEAGGKIGSEAKTDPEKAMWKGCVAGLTNEPATKNPYPVGSYLWLKWDEGWSIGFGS